MEGWSGSHPETESTNNQYSVIVPLILVVKLTAAEKMALETLNPHTEWVKTVVSHGLRLVANFKVAASILALAF